MDLRVKLPILMIAKLEELRKEWGLHSRSAVIKRLLEVVLEEKQDRNWQDKEMFGKLDFPGH